MSQLQADVIAWAGAYFERWASDAQAVYRSISRDETLPDNAMARLRTLGYVGSTSTSSSATD